MNNENTAVENKTAAKNKLRLYYKPEKNKMLVLLIVFAWIALWNIVFQIVHNSWHDLPVVSWAFFISVTIFFMQEELTARDKFLHTLVGGTVGLLIAAGITAGTSALVVNAGLPKLPSICIFILIAIALLILLKPIFPMFFNNVGFCYMIISLIDSQNAVAALPRYLFSLVLGSLILNLGCIILIKAFMKRAAKKAAQERQ